MIFFYHPNKYILIKERHHTTPKKNRKRNIPTKLLQKKDNENNSSVNLQITSNLGHDVDPCVRLKHPNESHRKKMNLDTIQV